MPPEMLERLVNEILMVRDNEYIHLVGEDFNNFNSLLKKIDFEKQKEYIKTLSDRWYKETYFGLSESSGASTNDGKGVFLGEVAKITTSNPRDRMRYGFQIWLLPESRLALYLFSEKSHSSGSFGMGYTGYEESEIKYRTSFKRIVKIK